LSLDFRASCASLYPQVDSGSSASPYRLNCEACIQVIGNIPTSRYCCFTVGDLGNSTAIAQDTSQFFSAFLSWFISVVEDEDLTRQSLKLFGAGDDVAATGEGGDLNIGRLSRRLLQVKRLQRQPKGVVQVTSDNTAYDSFTVNLQDEGTDFVIVGRVVWVGRKLGV
jgi:hypothetical protein